MVSDKPLVIDDSELQYPVFSEVCTFCRHWDATAGRVCDAFPDGIPDPIWLGEHKHKEPYEGDNGIQFEKLTEEEIKELAAEINDD